MTAKQPIAQVIELDGEIFQRDGENLVPIDDLADIPGDKWLLTDFQEGQSALMTVEGPVKYAELLARRKLQETGEFDEPVEIFTHWKKKRGKATTDIFFTAVPSRLTSDYRVETGQQDDITLVFAVYGILWSVLRKMAGRNDSKAPVAVVLRHKRFAEVVVGSKDQVFFANRCVAFDTEKEQIDTLWETVKSDIETVENEQRATVSKIVHINWIDADETPHWPEQWRQRLVAADRQTMQWAQTSHNVSLPQVLQAQSAAESLSAFKEKLCHYTKRWAPAVNVAMALGVVVLLCGLVGYRADARELQQRLEAVHKQIGQVRTGMPRPTLSEPYSCIKNMPNKV